ncbi:hypothetical protein BB561_004581 [Smittium simulii]|uniref:Uncharacterized protein n=1 Tax=Smittium simulii TaxID=133385 RepID=A0A2T9YFL5_9FUNG|nr:hypothetical protein BB561_004581 [Smittium simulii]
MISLKTALLVVLSSIYLSQASPLQSNGYSKSDLMSYDSNNKKQEGKRKNILDKHLLQGVPKNNSVYQIKGHSNNHAKGPHNKNIYKFRRITKNKANAHITLKPMVHKLKSIPFERNVGKKPWNDRNMKNSKIRKSKLDGSNSFSFNKLLHGFVNTANSVADSTKSFIKNKYNSVFNNSSTLRA